ncbi:DHA2 family efflux MFS transporter permease subunit [Psychrobacter sp. FDAARGOS_221]|uniref:DHA2 family efflux MFS transporter permease subunit n=1 Tax=Psychrobacter sp. FDAARGOS_221 TaxID=1975705 RepID=UPI000BB54FB0|nr:DHA2 family efflux MFS transporter permease subunit [Psychrobacter sp. FDAARGOS_221]PNK59595.1 MFS transporter [Psychrobacter sp. FDAARGOS_221]
MSNTKTPAAEDEAAEQDAPKVKLSAKQLKYLPTVLAIALFMQILDASILNTALPEMAKALDASPLKMQWAIISYALTLAIFIPVSGYLADKYGTKKVFLFAIVIFCLGSLLCALAPNLTYLVGFRLIQGVGGAMMTPVARLVLVKSYPRSQLLTVMNYALIPALVAPLVGPLIGGYLVQYASWHWIFLINVPMGVLGLILTVNLIPDLKEDAGKLDWRGFILFAVAAAMLTLAVEMLSKSGQGTTGLGLIVFSLILLAGYIYHARRCDHAIFPISLFSVRTFKVGIIGNLFTRIGISAIPYLLPLILQVEFKYTPSQAGWLLTPIAVGAIGIKPLVSPIIRKFSYQKVLLVNTFFVGLLIIVLAQFDASMSWVWLVPLLVVMGACNSLQFSALNTITVADLKGSLTSSGNSLMAVNQQLAISFGIAIGASILAIFTDRLHFDTVTSFHATYYVLGIFTILSGLHFLHLNTEDGRGVY